MRDVFNPHITNPDANTEWPVGSKQTVTWETADIPPDSQLTRPDGKILLGHLGPVGGMNLDFDHPLAQGFKLRDGKVQITVPDVAPRDDYIIILMGDSGNASPSFAITRITNGGGNSSSSISKTQAPSSTQTSTPAAPSPTPSSTGTDDPNNAVASPSGTDAPSSASSTLSLPVPITGTVITGGVSSDSSTPSGSAPGPESSSAGSTSSAWSTRYLDSTKTFTIGIMSLTLMLAM
ncbi:hypothetical protein BDZ94DRAFT_1159402 [Collybia nuda]|uniref:Uncharacterized protein n=1 Tax=Collybia nuda TaxID=64659 RepID=A0A9P5YAK9_9AGAR|nr:hypothetical protein BDZ94DRAFT_1159402 [Collybia nuda]